MNKDQAAAFIQAINAVQPYVPPLLFAQIVNNPLCNTLSAIAGGMIEFVPKPHVAAESKDTDQSGS